MKKNLLTTIRRMHESKADLEQCVDLLIKLQLDQGPIIEVLTVLRYEKPILFSWLKTRLSFRPGLQMMLDIRLDYDEAVRRLSPKPDIASPSEAMAIQSTI